MMLEIFIQESRAFYRVGDLFLMEKIPEKHWLKFIERSFKDTGKSIKTEIVNRMIEITINHTDYLQQLSHNVWNALSNTKLNLLNAILGGETKLTASETMLKYRLGTPRNVTKNKQVLET